MKVTILKEKLKEGLSVVERAAAKSSSLPILSNILMVADKNSLELSATDLEVGIQYKALTKNEEDGSVVVPSKYLSQFVALLPEDYITLYTTSGNLAFERKGRITNIRVLGAEDFPIIPQPKTKEDFIELQTAVMCNGLNQVVHMAGQIQARPEISGIFFSFEKDALKLVATDSFRLGEKTISFSKPLQEEHSFILPQKAAREIVAVLSDRPGKTKIYISPSQAVFEYIPEDPLTQPHIQIVSRLIEGEYPKYQDVIPTNHKTTTILIKTELINSLKAASIFAGKLQDVRCIADPKQKGFEISAQNGDIGEHTSLLLGEIHGERSEATFNWRFFLEGALQIRGERVKVGMGGEDAPAVIRPVDQEGFLYVVMPIRA